MYRKLLGLKSLPNHSFVVLGRVDLQHIIMRRICFNFTSISGFPSNLFYLMYYFRHSHAHDVALRDVFLRKCIAVDNIVDHFRLLALRIMARADTRHAFTGFLCRPLASRDCPHTILWRHCTIRTVSCLPIRVEKECQSVNRMGRFYKHAGNTYGPWKNFRNLGTFKNLKTSIYFEKSGFSTQIYL